MAILQKIKRKLGSGVSELAGAADPVLTSSGYCPICAGSAKFVAKDEWLRDHFRCTGCGSIPRQRALMLTLQNHYPNWRDLVIHESSPSAGGASQVLSEQCGHYIASHYFSDQKPGSMSGQFRCENLEAMTFEDASIDVHISQDVLEHVFDPKAVFREVARTLRPGGAHIFTVPIVNKFAASSRRARLQSDGQIEHLAEPSYHGNPIDEQGSLVTVDWGFDICRHIFEASHLFTQIFHIDDLSMGIRAEYIEVLVTCKPGAAVSGDL